MGSSGGGRLAPAWRGCHPPNCWPTADQLPASSWRAVKHNWRASPEGRLAMRSPTLKIEHARYILTLDGPRRVIQDGSILVEGDRIGRVAKAAELAAVPADRVIDARHLLVTPGFVNGHMH